jgi:hypothetical protein
MEFLWVRWLGIEPGHRSGSKVARLPKVGFVEETDEDAFGFLDQDLIIRSSHLIPDFNSGRTSKLFLEEDATSVLIRHSFVDRDMFMRYLGGGIGHLEQFPPAHKHDGNTAEDERDDFTIARTSGDGGSSEGELDGEAGGSNDGDKEGGR